MPIVYKTCAHCGQAFSAEEPCDVVTEYGTLHANCAEAEITMLSRKCRVLEHALAEYTSPMYAAAIAKQAVGLDQQMATVARSPARDQARYEAWKQTEYALGCAVVGELAECQPSTGGQVSPSTHERAQVPDQSSSQGGRSVGGT